MRFTRLPEGAARLLADILPQIGRLRKPAGPLAIDDQPEALASRLPGA